MSEISKGEQSASENVKEELSLLCDIINGKT